MKGNKYQILITPQELLYYAFFVILLFAKGIGLYEGMLSFNICILASLGCMAGALLLTDYTIREWIAIIAAIVCSFMAYRISGEKATIITVLVIAGMKNIPLKRIMNIAFTVWTITFYGMLFVHLAGWKEEIVLAHNKFGLGFLLRHSLGFPHPNVLHISFVIWMALLLYVCKYTHKQLVKISIWLAIENIFIFLFSISITGLALGFMYLILNYYFFVRRELILVERVAIKAVLPLCILMSIIPPLLFQGRLFDILNKLLNTRMNIWKYYLTTFAPGILGTRVYSPESGVMSLDCSYLYLLYYYGIILFVAIMGLMYWTISRYVKENRKEELAIILGMLVAGIVEPYLFNFSFKNLILLFMGHELFKALKEKSDKRIVLFSFMKKEITLNLSQVKWNLLEKKADLFEINQNLHGTNLYTTNAENQNTIKQLKKLCVITGVIIGVIAGIYTAITYNKPEEIYVQTYRCDYVSGPGVTKEEIADQENCWILGYQNEETRFYGFHGNMITLEYFRGIIVNIVFGCCLGGGVIFIGSYMVTQTRNKNVRKV